MDEIRKIQAALDAGISKSAIAARSGVARRVMDGFGRDDWNPRLQTLRDLAAAAEALAAEQIARLKGVA